MIKFEKGKIVTDLQEDIELFTLIMRKWARYNENEIDALINSIEGWELTEHTLMTDGFDILENLYFIEGEMITLIKVGQGEWVIKDYSDEEMQEFVESLV